MTGILAGMLLSGFAGCGIPATPQPPSLNLPQIVETVQAQRTGSVVRVEWTAPTENTDKTRIKSAMTAQVCRSAPPSAPCVPVASQPANPGQTVEIADALPGDLQQGEPTAIAYEVAMLNARGRSAGWSAPQLALAGPDVPAVESLTAENTANGVKLGWKTAQFPVPSDLIFRITRSRISAAAAPQARQSSSFGADKVPVVQTLEVNAPMNLALDNHTEWGEQYRYQVQAVRQVTVAGANGPRKLEMLSAASAPVEVQTKDSFPPAAPKGLVAVPTWSADGTPGVDLSWEPNTEAGIAGYQVIRIGKLPHRALESRQVVSGSLVTSPSFEDHGLQPGNRYVYTVVAVDKAGNVSPESNSVTEVARAKDK